MLSWDERLMIGLKVLEKLRHTHKAQSLPSATPAGNNRDEKSGLEDHFNQGSNHPKNLEAINLPSLEMMLEDSGLSSPYSMILGLCNDGLPFLIDLTNPAPGGLLIAGDQSSGKTRLANSMVSSTILLNTPDQVAFYLLTQFPYQYASLAEDDHCQGIFSITEDPIDELISECVQIVEDRKNQIPFGPVVLLVIDDLHSCLQRLDSQTYAKLYWLIRHGPRARVWTVATYSTQRAESIEDKFLSAFRTRIIGHIGDRRKSDVLLEGKKLATRNLESGYEFCVPYGDDWTHFWICDSQSFNGHDISMSDQEDAIDP